MVVIVSSSWFKCACVCPSCLTTVQCLSPVAPQLVPIPSCHHQLFLLFSCAFSFSLWPSLPRPFCLDKSLLPPRIFMCCFLCLEYSFFPPTPGNLYQALDWEGTLLNKVTPVWEAGECDFPWGLWMMVSWAPEGWCGSVPMLKGFSLCRGGDLRNLCKFLKQNSVLERGQCLELGWHSIKSQFCHLLTLWPYRCC